LRRSSIVFVTVFILYFVFLIQLSTLLNQVEINEVIKALIVIFFLFVGLGLLAYSR